MEGLVVKQYDMLYIISSARDRERERERERERVVGLTFQYV